MEEALKIFTLLLSSITIVITIYYFMNSKKIYKDYKKTYKKPKSELKHRLNKPSEAIRKFHIFIAPFLLALCVWAIYMTITNWS